jgi:hypothetical protein
LFRNIFLAHAEFLCFLEDIRREINMKIHDGSIR